MRDDTPRTLVTAKQKEREQNGTRCVDTRASWSFQCICMCARVEIWNLPQIPSFCASDIVLQSESKSKYLLMHSISWALKSFSNFREKKKKNKSLLIRLCNLSFYTRFLLVIVTLFGIYSPRILRSEANYIISRSLTLKLKMKIG